MVDMEGMFRSPNSSASRNESQLSSSDSSVSGSSSSESQQYSEDDGENQSSASNSSSSATSRTGSHLSSDETGPAASDTSGSAPVTELALGQLDDTENVELVHIMEEGGPLNLRNVAAITGGGVKVQTVSDEKKHWRSAMFV